MIYEDDEVDILSLHGENIMAWKRFPVPEFDHRSLRNLNYTPPNPISEKEEEALVISARAGDTSQFGAYAVMPNAELLKRLNFRGDVQQMILCILPSEESNLLGRSMAWFNQRAYILNGNSADAKVIYEWRTPRTHNTRLGPDNGVKLDDPVVYLLSARILEDENRGNRVMIDQNWTPENGRQGYRIIAGSDKDETNFHDSCFMVSWS